MAKDNTKKGRRKKADRSSDSPANEPHSVPSSLSAVPNPPPRRRIRGTGSAAAGQAGALQGLPRDPDADSQSVEELVEEGQSHEADILSGIEDAPLADESEVHTHMDDD